MGRKNEIIMTMAEHSLALQALVFGLDDKLQRLQSRLDENDADIKRLVEDFDEMDLDTAGGFESIGGRLDVHNTFITDLGERLEALEPAAPMLERLSLRDWFAGQALAWLLAGGETGASFRDFADEAYSFADAMLLARG